MHGGHQSAGMTIEQTAKQELMEEVGIDTNLTFHKIRFYQDSKQSEFEYVYYGIHDGPYGFDRNEVETLKFFDPEKFINGEYDDKYAFVEPFAKEYVKDLKKVWVKLKKNYQKKVKQN